MRILQTLISLIKRLLGKSIIICYIHPSRSYDASPSLDDRPTFNLIETYFLGCRILQRDEATYHRDPTWYVDNCQVVVFGASHGFVNRMAYNLIMRANRAEKPLYFMTTPREIIPFLGILQPILQEDTRSHRYAFPMLTVKGWVGRRAEN